ncbi:unnamed protein product [Penicillium egyptiacum]|uniref:Uncharacterized protein n=1 Tax=Penicillium egyptiacum TaxID=1303716 RepID=A0A9W4KAS8_9EURO|nr:unnamed protein product [Penicillium egyptiacum]
MGERVPPTFRPNAMRPDCDITGPANPNHINLSSDAGTNALLVDIRFDGMKSDTGVIDFAANVNLIDPYSDINVTRGPRMDPEVRCDPPRCILSYDVDMIKFHSDNGAAGLTADVVAIDESSIPHDNIEATQSNSGAEAGAVASIPRDAVNVTKASSKSKTTSVGSVPPNTVNSWSFALAAGLCSRLAAIKLQQTGWEWSSGTSNLPQWFLAAPGQPWIVAKETKMIKKGVTIMGWLRCGLYLFFRTDSRDLLGGEITDLTAYHEPNGSHRIMRMDFAAWNDLSFYAMASLEDHEALVTGHHLGYLAVWDVRRGHIIYSLRGLHYTVSCIVAEKDIIVAGSFDGTICVWDITRSNNLHALQTLKGHAGAVLCLKLHDKYLVSGGEDRDARVWDIETGECKHVLQGHEKAVRFVCMSEHAIVTAGTDDIHYSKSEILIWLKNTEEFTAGRCNFGSRGSELVNHLHLVGNDLIAAGDYGSVVKWDVTSGQRLVLYRQDFDGVVALATSEKFVMVGKKAGDLYLLDQVTMHRVRLMDFASEIWKVGILDGSRVIAAYKQDGHAYLTIWHV